MKKKRFLFMFAALLAIVQGAWAQSTATEVLDWDNWCSITLKLTDSYGDGWNTNAIQIVDVLTGKVLGTYTNTNENNQSQAGIAQIYQAEVPDDRDIRFEWVRGNFYSECSYEVYDVNGKLIFSGSDAMNGPVTYRVECTILPFNLQTADVTATTATLTWDGAQNSYNVRYRTNPSIIEGFEDADEFANWQAFGVVSTITANDRFGRLSDAKKTDLFGFSFSSYKNASDYNQYLISPEVSGVLSVDFYYRASNTRSSGETFKVGYSTTGNNVADFIWSNQISTNSTSWSHFEDNNVPDGVKYVAIHYYDDYQYQLFVDDMTINCGSAGDWNETNTNVTSPLAIDGLVPETKYEWQVQGLYSLETTDWSDMAKFTTNIVKLDATKTLAENQSAYGTATKFLLDRTLTAGQWNTFASPFAIESGDMDKYFGAGAKVRKLGTTTIEEGNILSLNFVAASSIDAGHPYIVKPAANVDFSADGKEFEGPVGRTMTVLNGVAVAIDEMPGVSADFENRPYRYLYLSVFLCTPLSH